MGRMGTQGTDGRAETVETVFRVFGWCWFTWLKPGVNEIEESEPHGNKGAPFCLGQVNTALSPAAATTPCREGIKLMEGSFTEFFDDILVYCTGL
jgi:hypothetical protein